MPSPWALSSMGFSSVGDKGAYNQKIRYSIGSADMEWEAQSAGTSPFYWQLIGL